MENIVNPSFSATESLSEFEIQVKKFNQLEISILHLSVIRNEISRLLEAMEKVSRKLSGNSTEELQVMVGCLSFCLIKCNSIFEELNKYLLNSVDRIKREKINRQLLLIKERYPDVSLFRHQMLAHPYRDRNSSYDSIFLRPNALSSYRIPENIERLIFYLSDCTNLVDIVTSMFPTESKKVEAIL